MLFSCLEPMRGKWVNVFPFPLLWCMSSLVASILAASILVDLTVSVSAISYKQFIIRLRGDTIHRLAKAIGSPCFPMVTGNRG